MARFNPDAAFSRTEWAQLQNLTPEQRIVGLEKSADEFEAQLNVIALSIKVQTRAIMAGMVTIILFLAGIVFKA